MFRDTREKSQRLFVRNWNQCAVWFTRFILLPQERPSLFDLPPHLLFCDRSQPGKRFFRPRFPPSKRSLLGRSIRELVSWNARMRRNLSDGDLEVDIRWVKGCGRSCSPECLDVGINRAEDELAGLKAYIMDNVGGVSVYLARDQLRANDGRLLRVTLTDFARFFASPWHNRPTSVSSPSRPQLYASYEADLKQLREGLSSQWHIMLDNLLQGLPLLFASDWPMVPNHTDLLENNIHVDSSTGHITGICDWQDTTVSPFGTSLWGVESMLGERTTIGWRSVGNSAMLRRGFWEAFAAAAGPQVPIERVEVARLVGIFSKFGFEWVDQETRRPVMEGSSDFSFLKAVTLNVDTAIFEIGFHVLHKESPTAKTMVKPPRSGSARQQIIPARQNGNVGINYGSIQLPPERPETPPTPLSTVPFRRDPDFVSRDILLEQIHEKISIPGSRIALVGIGGVGKSQLGIEYSYRVRSESPATWVFWVYASNAARFEQSFRDIADRAKIIGRHDPTVNIYQLVESWLQNDKSRKWLLILDNIDDDGFLRQPSAMCQETLTVGQTNASKKPLLEFLPRSPNGSIIITSRSQEVALKIFDHLDIIKVEPMNKAEALELLQRKLRLPAETPDMANLLEELEFMPLAIIQAAGYIKSDRNATKLLAYEAGHLYRDWEAKNSILVTWQISFDHVRRMKPSAADLLSLMSFFDRQGVSENLLRVQGEIRNDDSSSEIMLEYSDERTDSASASETGRDFGDQRPSATNLLSLMSFSDRQRESGDLLRVQDFSVDEDTDSPCESETNHDFEDDITVLRDFSFVSINKDSTEFTMHRLVQLTVHVWLKANSQLERWKEQFIMVLWQRFPTGEYENWARCQSLFPHVKSAMSQRPKSQESLVQWATLLYRGAWYAQESGNFVESRDMASKSRKQRALIFGSEGEQTLKSTAMLAGAYRLEGGWEEAEQLFVQVMQTRKAKLGADHPDTLTSMANLASTYRSQGRWEEAEQLFLQVMETRKTKLGADHPVKLGSMNNLAYTPWSTRQQKAALLLMAECARLCEQKPGPDHPHTMSSNSTLNKRRTKAYSTSSSSQLTKTPNETKENHILASPESSKRASKPGGHHRRKIFSRLFSKNQDSSVLKCYGTELVLTAVKEWKSKIYVVATMHRYNTSI
ncbi:hypothetical protein N7466_011116 [Penicillium verhagenii]|uniref:uncharacterized protein n=1 Tax=Penicillium verhagenii TaxID=1562060 RepID=UPI002545897D|nr:uncharacterized protein N7466_011116 [Penicillium verhagenii]KAJ5917562.1 hypothetical protein N7466_011116 [Penicillium verhagenii]